MCSCQYRLRVCRRRAFHGTERDRLLRPLRFPSVARRGSSIRSCGRRGALDKRLQGAAMRRQRRHDLLMPPLVRLCCSLMPPSVRLCRSLSLLLVRLIALPVGFCCGFPVARAFVGGSAHFPYAMPDQNTGRHADAPGEGSDGDGRPSGQFGRGHKRLPMMCSCQYRPRVFRRRASKEMGPPVSRCLKAAARIPLRRESGDGFPDFPPARCISPASLSAARALCPARQAQSRGRSIAGRRRG